MSDQDHDHDDSGIGGVPISPSTSTAVAALTGLGKALTNVARVSRTGRRSNPLMQFVKDGGGTWVIGQRRIEVEAGSQWALNPLSFEWGFIAFPGVGKAPEQIMALVTESMPDPAQLIAKGLKPNEQRTVDLKCLSGTDLDTQVTFCTTTTGGIDEMNRITGIIGDRISSGRYGDKICPIVVLERGGYKHQQQEVGWVATPLLKIVGWQSINGPEVEPEPSPAPAAAEQPRRRRVG
jgi:hypothetical protein